MGVMRRLFSIGTGLAAGVLAYKLVERYNENALIEGEYQVVPLKSEDPAEQTAADEQAAACPETPDMGPIPNPVTRGNAETPLTPDGKIDPTRVAEAADFGDWDNLGCQG